MITGAHNWEGRHSDLRGVAADATLPHENDMFTSPVEPWPRYADARIDTSHDYDGQKAQACLPPVPEFIDDA